MAVVTACLFILSGCHSTSDNTQNLAIDRETGNEELWRYQLAKMDEDILIPSKAKGIRIIISIPYGGKTTVIRSTFLGDKYQVVKKLADGGINDVSYEATAVGYTSSTYEANWEAAMDLLRIAKFDTTLTHAINDFAIASVETVDEYGTTLIDFPFCGRNAEIVGRVTDKLLVQRDLGVGPFPCPAR